MAGTNCRRPATWQPQTGQFYDLDALGLPLAPDRAVIVPELELKRLVVLDIAGFPIVRHWHVVHHRQKRLPPVAEAFTRFLHADGVRLIAELVHQPTSAKPRRQSGR